MIFNYIKAAKFFPKYAHGVKDWKKKMTGKNGRGNPVTFSDQDKKEIKAGVKKLCKELSKQKL